MRRAGVTCKLQETPGGPAVARRGDIPGRSPPCLPVGRQRHLTLVPRVSTPPPPARARRVTFEDEVVTAQEKPPDSAVSPKVSPRPGVVSPKVSPRPNAVPPKVSPRPRAVSLKVSPRPGSVSPKVSPQPGAVSPKVSPEPGAVSPKVSPPPGAVPDYVARYPAIRSPRQRAGYLAVFQDQRQEFRDLLRELRVTCHPPGSTDPSRPEKQRRCEYLKAKLSHLKARICHFDRVTRATPAAS